MGVGGACEDRSAMRALVRFMNDERGAVLTEYGLLVVLIAVVCTASVTTLGGIFNGLYTIINTALVPAL